MGMAANPSGAHQAGRVFTGRAIQACRRQGAVQAGTPAGRIDRLRLELDGLSWSAEDVTVTRKGYEWHSEAQEIIQRLIGSPWALDDPPTCIRSAHRCGRY